MKRTYLILLQILILFLAVTIFASNNQQTLKSNKTLFLTLIYDGEKVVLEQSRVIDSSVKQKRLANLSKAIKIDLKNINSNILMQESIDDPLVKIYEVEDPDNPGQFLQKVVTLSNTTFNLRLPYFDELETIEFFKTEVDQTKNNQSVVKKISSISRGQIQEMLHE